MAGVTPKLGDPDDRPRAKMTPMPSQPRQPAPGSVEPTDRIEPTDRTTIRVAKRAHFDRATLHAILDDACVAHVGFAVDGQPFVIPMVYGRDGDRLYLHGSVATRVMRALDAGAPVCLTVTHLDGLVLARSHFHHSVNYRSAVVLGTARRLDGDDAQRAFAVIVDHVVPGRAAETRPANRVETRQTMVLELALEEASVKIRTGGPIDDPDDLDEPDAAATWAGVVPLASAAGRPIPDEFTDASTPLPPSVVALLVAMA